MAEVYMCFHQSVLLTFTNFNKFLWTEEPLIQCLYDQIQSFMNKLASKFIKPEVVIQQLKQEGSSFTKTKHYTWKSKVRLQFTHWYFDQSIASKTSRRWGHFREQFYDGIRAFYESVYEYEYCVKWLPADNTLYKNCQFWDIFKEMLFHLTAWQKFLLFS